MGPDGCAAFAAFSFVSYVRTPCYYGVQFQVNISASNSSPYSEGWVGLNNVGDERGRFGHGFEHSVGACISGLPQGSYVRAHIYRLDGNDESSCYMAVRTTPVPRS